MQWESGKLANEGEAIELTSPSGIIVDQVRYLPTTPWPVLEASAPNAIVLKDVVKANNIAANWMQKPEEVIDNVDVPWQTGLNAQRAYDLQGRQVNPKSVRGLLIINGKKVLRK